METTRSIDGTVKITKVNLAEVGALGGRFDVQSTPKLILFKDGDEIRRFVGVQP